MQDPKQDVDKEWLWNARQSSPYTSRTYDLVRYYFFNYWMRCRVFPTAYGLRHRLYTTSWYDAEKYAPSIGRLVLWIEQFKKEIC